MAEGAGCVMSYSSIFTSERSSNSCLSLSHQKSGAGGKKMQKSAEESDSGEEEAGPDVDEDDEDKHAVEHPPHPSTASWFSDHNYIAVTPEKTPPMSPTVLNKKCMYLFKGLRLSMKPHQCFSIITGFSVMVAQFRASPHSRCGMNWAEKQKFCCLKCFEFCCKMLCH